MSGQLTAYREEIFNFLRTVTIKFEPFAYLMGSKYMQQYGLEDPHHSWNPYYINLTGEYTEQNTPMQVYSAEVNAMVTFDKTLVTRYPKTAALYKLPNKEYQILEERYPGNVGLIRTIAYPVGDMDTVLKAPNLSLLGYDASLLEANERFSLVSTLKKFLAMVNERWWVREYCYEDMYAVTFWAMLWQLLPVILLLQRFLNIKTPAAHSYHIWEYLLSKGLGDYRDALTENQTNWLYRNIDYILNNKGKSSNLEELADNLLEEVFVSLIEKDLIQRTDNFDKDYIPNPGYINNNVSTGQEDSREDHESVHDKLVESGLDEEKTVDELEKEKDDLGNHPYNELPTKLLEFKKEAVNTSNTTLMTNFFLDTLINQYVHGNLSFFVSIVDPLTKNVCRIYVNDALAFWWYTCKRAIRETPRVLPTKYKLHLPFMIKKPNKSDIRQSIFYDSTEYRIRELIDFDKMIDIDIPWQRGVFSTVRDFADHLSEQFRTLLYFYTCMEQSNKFLYHRAMQSFFEDVRSVGWVDFHLSEETQYDVWIAQHPCIKEIIENTSKESDQDRAWENLNQAIFDALFPIDYEKYKEFMGDIRYLENIYVSIRDLFIQLGSYNITYLETDRTSYRYMRIREPEFYTGKTNYVMDDFWILIIQNILLKGKSCFHLDLPELDVTFPGKSAGILHTIQNKLVVGIDWSKKTTMYDYGIVQNKVDIEQTSKTIFHTQNITIETH